MKLYKFRDGQCCYSEKEALDYFRITKCELSSITDTTKDSESWKKTLEAISNRPLQNSFYYEL